MSYNSRRYRLTAYIIKKIVSAVFMLTAFFGFFNYGCFCAEALAQTPAREINLQNIALNKCEQYIKANKIELAAKSFEEAASYRRAVESNPNFLKVRELFEKKRKEYIKDLTDKGNQLFLEKKYEDCKKIFTKVSAIAPENLQALDKIQLCEEQLKLLERKREVYHNPSLDIKTIEKWDSERLKTVSMQAINMISQKNFSAALQLLLECKKKDPNNPYFDEKIKSVKKFIQIIDLSNNFNKKTMANPMDATCEIILKTLESEDGDYKLRRYALEDKNFSKHMISISRYYLAHNRHDEAESVLKSSLNFTGISDETMFLLAKIFYERQDYVQSYHTFKTLRVKEDLAAEFKPQIRGYYYELLFRLYKLLIMTVLIQLTILSVIAYRSYEIIDYAFEGVITRFFTFRMYDSKYYYEKGMIHYNKSNFERAITNLTKAISLDKSNVSAYHTLGLCYYRKKTYDQARLSFETVIKMTPNNQRAAYYLALLYDYMKMPKEAVRMLEIARGITVTNRNFTMLEIEKNKRLYLGTFQDYKLSADKILNLNEPILD
mgnify:CR=1 FL=1